MALNYKIIGNRIQLRRKQKGVTQEQMAESLGFSVGFISQIERGITKMSLDSFSEIVAYLGCTTSEILDDSTRNDSAYCQTELNSIYELLSPEEQRLVFSMLESFVKNAL